MQEEQLFKGFFRDGQEPALFVDVRVSAAGRVVDQRHLAEARARSEDREGFFAHAPDVAADADAARDDDVELLAGLALAEDHVGHVVVLLFGDGGDQDKRLLRETTEENDLTELRDTFGGSHGRTVAEPEREGRIRAALRLGGVFATA